MAAFRFQELFELGEDSTPYRKLGDEHVSVTQIDGREVLKIEPQALSQLAAQAVRDVSHLFRPSHLAQLARILEDPDASDNDRIVALELLKNANISAEMVLPSCQDTGTAIVIGKKGQGVYTGFDDEEELSRGIYETYANTNLRYSQMAPISMYDEKNTGTNLPAQVELYATPGSEYKFLFMTKGGGSANKTFLFQETRALLNEDSLMAFMAKKLPLLGTAACPPYHLAIVIGGTSAEFTLKTVKLASARYLDTLPTTGNEFGRAFRDPVLEEKIHKLTQDFGIGAQFGGKYFCHDVRVIRLPRHGASCPVGVGVSCSADRQILGKITRDGVFLEQLETEPARYLPEPTESEDEQGVVKLDLDRPMSELRETLSQYPVTTRLLLTGTIVVARDIAHAKLKELLDQGKPLPDYIKDHIVYYAGPAKTPEGYASGSFGPTTAGRMDSYVDLFMENGGSFVTLAKGNRSQQVTDACKKHGGFYLGSIGGGAAILARNSIKKVGVLEFEELGMEAVWKIEVEDFPAFIIVDDKGNDFYAQPRD
ncbi:MAG: fumarate hydratase [Myxococcota bacterium]|jgi:fumarate hydratase class I|nr:fumarate hydratase [Myxococcota bacterium]